VLGTALNAYSAGPAIPANSLTSATTSATTGDRSSRDQAVDPATVDPAVVAEHSRDAGLLTDWHLTGRYGHAGAADFARRFDPERWSARDRHLRNLRYELLFPEGTFVLPPELAGRDGVFYAMSRVYLSGSGDWNLYLESGAEAMVFVDGRRVLARGDIHKGTLRETIHAESGYHNVMVKFTAQSAPFRLAILPPNSGSRRKNNTPYLQGTEDLAARLQAPISPTDWANPDQTTLSNESTPLRPVSSATFWLRWLSEAKISLARRT